MNASLFFPGQGIVSLEPFESLRVIRGPDGRSDLLLATRTVVEQVESGDTALEQAQPRHDILAVFPADPTKPDGRPALEALEQIYWSLSENRLIVRMLGGSLPGDEIVRQAGLVPPEGSVKPRKFGVSLLLGDTPFRVLKDLEGQRVSKVEVAGTTVGIYTEG